MEDQDQQDLGSELAARGSKRRRFVRAGLALGGLGALGRGVSAFAADKTIEMPMASGTRLLAKYPQKRELILLTARPVQLETPMAVFDEGAFTPNDAFFVRWHLAGVPTAIDPGAFRIAVQGHVKQTLTLSLADLKRDFEQVEIAAVCQCSGNSRGFFEPRVAGGQWANGAMGNALWKGVRLRDVLNKAGVEADAVQVRFNGADQPAMDVTPDFVKALDTDVALNEDVLIAYEMNGAPLPHLNGYPARVIIPGWTGTYWVKHIVSIEAVTKPYDGFWMKSAYRFPNGKFPVVAHFPTQETAANTPITEMVVNSLITSMEDGAKVKAGKITVSGIAWDAGYGIASVKVSTDGRKSWAEATLGTDLGSFAFRTWSYPFDAKPGANTITVRASNEIGQTQTTALIPNPAGYHHNVMQSLTFTAS